jgi:hypothetical protein
MRRWSATMVSSSSIAVSSLIGSSPSPRMPTVTTPSRPPMRRMPSRQKSRSAGAFFA